MTRVWLSLASGEIVVATVRTLSSLDYLIAKYPADRLLVVKCDVVMKSDIGAAFDGAYDKVGRVDVVFNNSGCMMAEVENDDQDEQARKLFEVNFWGAANVMREAVKSFRERNPAGVGGLLLNSSSGCGHAGLPGFGFYTASKHALEGLTESLAHELDPAWNIKISSIVLSLFKTEMHKGRLPILPPPKAYASPKLPAQQTRIAYTAENSPVPYGDPRKAIERIYAVSKLKAPPFRLPLGEAAVKAIREKWVGFEKEFDEYEGWSENLEMNSVDVSLGLEL